MDILVTDNGKEFKNKVMEELCKNNGVIQRFTSSYHPQSNAQCERQNRTILSVLKNVRRRNYLELGIKARSVPIFLQLTGASVDKEISIFRPPSTVTNSSVPPNIHKYSDTWANEALLIQQDMWGEIQDNLTKAAEVQKYQHNKNVKERKFEAGDLICVKDKTLKVRKNAKLTTKWFGPFVITKIAGDTNIII